MMASDTSADRKRILSSRLPLSSTSKSYANSITNSFLGNETSIEDDLRSNASTIGGVEVGSESAALGSRASVSEASIVGDDNHADAVSAASRWERMKTMGYRVGSIAESEEFTHNEKGKGRAFTGYDPQGKAHRRFRAESIASDTSSISYAARNNFPKVRPVSFLFYRCRLYMLIMDRRPLQAPGHRAPGISSPAAMIFLGLLAITLDTTTMTMTTKARCISEWLITTQDGQVQEHATNFLKLAQLPLADV